MHLLHMQVFSLSGNSQTYYRKVIFSVKLQNFEFYRIETWTSKDFALHFSKSSWSSWSTKLAFFVLFSVEATTLPRLTFLKPSSWRISSSVKFTKKLWAASFKRKCFTLIFLYCMDRNRYTFYFYENSLLAHIDLALPGSAIEFFCDYIS